MPKGRCYRRSSDCGAGVIIVILLVLTAVLILHSSVAPQSPATDASSIISPEQTPSSIRPQSWWDQYRGYEHLIVPIKDANGNIVAYDTKAADAAKAGGTPEFVVRTTTTTTNRPVTVASTPDTSSLKTQPRTTILRYKYGNYADTIPVTTYQGLYDIFRGESHTYYRDYQSEVIFELLENENQDHYLKSLLQTLSLTDPRVAISAVQHIPYDWSFGSDWRFPYETLRDNKGVCADKSILMAYFLREMGYDVVLFEFSQHMAVGIRCSGEYDYENTGYAFIETTRPAIITYVPDEYLGGYRLGTFYIIHVTNGGKSFSISQDYADAVDLKTLESMGSVLDQYHYSRWQYITSKYDTQYQT